ncbi:MAG: HPt (histidine-containing phosphotransfer) domain-containing protein [Crocinitomix sp.]|jgi:HPt (histidine-containing phosphotransfer) domain-containing protein
MDESNEEFDISKFTAGDNFFGQMIEAGVADDTFIREIVEMFLIEGAVSLQAIVEGFENDDQKTIRLYAHKLKSSFLMFDMHDAHALAEKLEQIEAPVSSSIESFSELQQICKQSFKLLRLKYLS